MKKVSQVISVWLVLAVSASAAAEAPMPAVSTSTSTSTSTKAAPMVPAPAPDAPTPKAPEIPAPAPDTPVASAPPKPETPVALDTRVYQPVQEIVRNAIPGSTFPISQSVQIPAHADTIYMSGTVPQVNNPEAEPGTREAYGDMETQTTSVLNELTKRLERIGLTMGDVVMMRAYLVGDPEKEGALDFQGFMKGYTKFFGTKAQPNLPSRSAFQIAGLAVPGWLVEIEVVAAKVPPK